MVETNRVLDDHDLEGIALRYGLFYGGAASGMLLNGVRKRMIPVPAVPETGDLGMLRGDDRAGVDVVVKITLGLNSATMPFFGFWSLALPGGGTGHEPSTGWCHGQSGRPGKRRCRGGG